MTDAEKIETLRGRVLRYALWFEKLAELEESRGHDILALDWRENAKEARAALAATAPQENEGDPVRVTITEDE